MLEEGGRECRGKAVLETSGRGSQSGQFWKRVAGDTGVSSVGGRLHGVQRCAVFKRGVKESRGEQH